MLDDAVCEVEREGLGAEEHGEDEEEEDEEEGMKDEVE